MKDNHPVVAELEVSKLDPNPFANRISQINCDDIQSSFRMHGQLSPIRVRSSSKDEARFEIVFGHRRIAAARALGWDRILAEIIPTSDEQMIVHALAENLGRKNYSDYEIGTYLRILNEKSGKTYDEIAQLICMSKTYVCDHIAITHLFESDEIDGEKVASVIEKISERQARVLSRVEDIRLRFHLAKLAVAEGLGARELMKLAGKPSTEVRSYQLSKKEDPPSSETEIRNIIDEVLEVPARKDMRVYDKFRFAKLFSQFDDIPPFDLLDYDSATEHSLRILRGMGKFQQKLERLRVYIFSKFAYATFFVTYNLRDNSGKWYTGMSRVTFVFVHSENKWRIAHEHWSPVDSQFMDQLQKIKI